MSRRPCENRHAVPPTVRGVWLAMLLALAWIALIATSAYAAASVVLDGEGGTGGRTTDSIGKTTSSVVYATAPNVFYYDATTGDLRWGHRNSAGWSFATLDGAGGAAGRLNANVGEDSAAAVFGGRLHVLYYDRTHGDLRHAIFDGTSWSFATLDGSGGAAGRVEANVGLRVSTIRFGTTLRVLYANTSAGDVRIATFDGSGWSFATLDGSGGAAGRVDANVGWNTGLAVFGGKLHALYLQQDPSCDPVCNLYGFIREATTGGTTWRFATIDNINCCHVDQSLAVGRRSSNDVYLFYENFGYTTVNIRALHWNGSSWSRVGCVGEPFVQDDIVGESASATVVNGVVRLTYYDLWSGTFQGSGVVHTSFDGTAWRTAMVGIDPGAPTSSLASGGLKVFVGDATVGTSTDDLALASPAATGIVEEPDTSCG